MKIADRRQIDFPVAAPDAIDPMRHRHTFAAETTNGSIITGPVFDSPNPMRRGLNASILDVSEAGVRLDVGALGAVPRFFGVAFNSDGKVYGWSDRLATG